LPRRVFALAEENALLPPEGVLGPARAGTVADKALATVKAHGRMEHECVGVPGGKTRRLGRGRPVG